MSTSRRWWFPRPRGDGPLTLSSMPALPWVSPPTRGWTFLPKIAPHQYRGFPAHAGMDRESPRPRRPIPRFPRPRGDGPVSLSVSPSLSLVSPPTRGWTREDVRHPRCVCGFPAHAGMDLPRATVSVLPRWFPRPRGDGPEGLEGGGTSGKVSPPTRGWTRTSTSLRGRRLGFPAHAGMDPLLSSPGRPITGFPRPRGDGPPPPGRISDLPAVSPPTRGWTWYRHPLSPVKRGFPAHAGMDPLPWQWTFSMDGFPRPRGDGPIYAHGNPAGSGVSPPTRGWTIGSPPMFCSV